MTSRLWLALSLLFATFAIGGQARAETDCEHFQRTLAALRSGAKVDSFDISKAMQTERSKLCNSAAPAARPAPIASAPPAPRPVAPASSGLTAGIPPLALHTGRLS